LNGADINIVVLKNGKANYDIAKSDSLQTGNEKKQDFSVKIEEYSFTNSNINYTDASLDMQMWMKNIQHTGNGVFSPSDYKLTTRTSMDTMDVMFDKIHYINNAQIDLDADIIIENDFTKYSIKDMLMSLNDLELTSDMMFEMKGDDIDMDITYATKQNSLKKLLSWAQGIYARYERVSAKGSASLKGLQRYV